MPARISLMIKAIIMGMMLLLATTSFALDSKTSTLLRFLGTEHTPFTPLLPASLPIANNFKPGTTPYAGIVKQVQGTVYVYHKDGTTVYTLKNNLSLFSGDTLVTGKKSRVTLQMADDTTLFLAPQTKLTIDRSLPRMKVRDTVLKLFFGRIRALVKKLTGEYIIKTPTASTGVRGTDFAVAVATAPKNSLPGWKKVPEGLLTAVLTGGAQSTVELAGFFGPPIMVKPFSAAGVYSGGQAEHAVYVGPVALPLLQKIGPNHKAQFIFPKQLILKKTALAVDPCWNFSIKASGLEGKGHFKVCKKATREPTIKLWPETK